MPLAVNSTNQEKKKSVEKTKESANAVAISDPHPHDVLFGRGNGVLKRYGNVYFRQLVNPRKQKYKNAQYGKEKRNVAHEIIQEVRKLDPPGRFLVRDESNAKWYETTDLKALRKTCQALREESKKPKVANNSQETEQSSQLIVESTPTDWINTESTFQDLSTEVSDLPSSDESTKSSYEDSTNEISFRRGYCGKSNHPKQRIKGERAMHFSNITMLPQLPAFEYDNPKPQKMFQSVPSLPVEVKPSIPLSSVNYSNSLNSKILNSSETYNAGVAISGKEKDLGMKSSMKVTPSTAISTNSMITQKRELSYSSNSETSRQSKDIANKISNPPPKKRKCNHDKFTIPLSCIGQSFRESTGVSCESKLLFEEISNLQNKGDNAILYLPGIVGRLCQRVVDLEQMQK